MSTDIKLRVAALTGGKNVASARFRVRQMIPALRDCGVHMREFVPLVSKYPPDRKWLRPFWGGAALAVRVPVVMATHHYDMVFFQRELISTFSTLEFLTRRPRVLDVDDAIFLRRGGRFTERLARQCELIICGNDYLADSFIRWNRNVCIIPTAVDTRRYSPKTAQAEDEHNVIGWTGMSSNFKYLYQMEYALAEVLKARADVIFRIIADASPNFRSIADDRIEFIRWSPESEVRNVQTMTIGIMPLADSAWERGKCSYKMLQYMACGVPVVVSPVGMNSQVLSMGAVGIGASTQNEWVEALLGLLSDTKVRSNMGMNGRSIVEKHFSIDVIAPRLAQCLRDLAL